LLNIIPYWSSPEVFARYYIMMMPIVFLVFFFLYLHEGTEGQRVKKILDVVILVVLGFIWVRCRGRDEEEQQPREAT